MLTVIKKFTFCYGHHLPNHPGKCKNVHGHNSEVEVEVGLDHCFVPDGLKDNGMIIDFGELKNLVNEILEKLDHQYLNETVPMMYLPPTAENLALFLKVNIKKALAGSGNVLIRIRVSETPTSWAEWKADG